MHLNCVFTVKQFWLDTIYLGVGTNIKALPLDCVSEMRDQL